MKRIRKLCGLMDNFPEVYFNSSDPKIKMKYVVIVSKYDGRGGM